MDSLKKTRFDLEKYAKTAIKYKGIKDTNCPLCGAPYDDWETLDENIKNRTKVLDELSDDSVNQIQMIKEQLYTSFFADIEEKILEEQQSAVSEKTYKKLQEVKNYKLQVIEIQKSLQKLDIPLPVVFEESISEINKGYNNLLQHLQGKLKKISEEVELQLDSKNFKEKYDKFYDNEEEKFLQKTAEMFRDKEKYIKILYYNSNLKFLGDAKRELKSVTKSNQAVNGL